MRDFEKAYSKGQIAGLDGELSTTNPYNQENDYLLWSNWINGYQVGAHTRWVMDTSEPLNDYELEK